MGKRFFFWTEEITSYFVVCSATIILLMWLLCKMSCAEVRPLRCSDESSRVLREALHLISGIKKSRVEREFRNHSSCYYCTT